MSYAIEDRTAHVDDDDPATKPGHGAPLPIAAHVGKTRMPPLDGTGAEVDVALRTLNTCPMSSPMKRLEPTRTGLDSNAARKPALEPIWTDHTLAPVLPFTWFT